MLQQFHGRIPACRALTSRRRGHEPGAVRAAALPAAVWAAAGAAAGGAPAAIQARRPQRPPLRTRWDKRHVSVWSKHHTAGAALLQHSTLVAALPSPEPVAAAAPPHTCCRHLYVLVRLEPTLTPFCCSRTGAEAGRGAAAVRRGQPPAPDRRLAGRRGRRRWVGSDSA